MKKTVFSLTVFNLLLLIPLLFLGCNNSNKRLSLSSENTTYSTSTKEDTNLDSGETEIRKLETQIKMSDQEKATTRKIISTSLIYKSFTQKNGYKTDFKEIYIQHHEKNYFIKFCRSEINRQALEKQFEEAQKIGKNIKLEVTFSNGYWDICDSNYQVQSRMGDYVIIHRIITN